ncbi:hypothetical protein PCL_07073 [Purpureocillium lilacinum]|uniref:Uncharacterized protein n=1 Tax=Purpureocillium lilacinum TaxID=33203 RepID=A0A2U3DT99_PURLI|nr:hypothetical protein PCL_07073 [Purpureocillium lilacinum]
MDGNPQKANLPPELRLQTLRFLPDIMSLKSATKTNSALYNSFVQYKGSIISDVLINEIGVYIYPYAVINFFTAKNIASTRSVPGLTQILHFDYLNEAYHSKLAATSLSLVDAEAIAGTYADAPPTTRQTPDLNGAVERLQNDLLKSPIAPWELDQVGAIQSFFQRTLVRMTRETYRRQTDTIPLQLIRAIIGSGLDDIHTVLCVADSLDQTYCEALGERNRATNRGYVFEQALGQAIKATKDHACSLNYEDFPKLCRGDPAAFGSRRKLQERPSQVLDSSMSWRIALRPELSVLGEHFGFWGIPFWDDDRWDDVLHAVAQSHLDYLLHLTYELDPHPPETIILD